MLFLLILPPLTISLNLIFWRFNPINCREIGYGLYKEWVRLDSFMIWGEYMGEVVVNPNKCCICGNKIIGHGHNAQPVQDGNCCDICNQVYVLPARRQQC